MDNYPPGFDPKSLDNPLEDLELPEDKMTVKYELKVYCGDDEDLVYSSDFLDEEGLQSDGLRKADHCIEAWRKKELDYLIDSLQDEVND